MIDVNEPRSLPWSYWSYWGKARPRDGDEVLFHLLPLHCLDVAAVGAEYLRQSPELRRLFAEVLGVEDGPGLEGWLTFWLALHDLGKFSETFQSQCPDVFDELKGRAPDGRMAIARERHDSLGMLLWKRDLCARAARERWFGPIGVDEQDALSWWARAVTGHHGQPPKEDDKPLDFFFHARDRDSAACLANDLRPLLLTAEGAALIAESGNDRFYRASSPLSWWMSGVSVLADWIGSNTEFFPYRSRKQDLATYWTYARSQARQALAVTGVMPARSQPVRALGELFAAIATPSPLQQWASTAFLGDGPQIHILEDVTGAGKTEAALMLAHRLIARGMAEGFFIGLPTMATANAMYGRLAPMYRSMFADHPSLVLATSQRELVEPFAASIVRSGPAEHDDRQVDETATARCAAWLADHNKRSLMAPAGVGTIDQALLAALMSKHQSLRLLGLFRKVLIVDEVHACDAYMQGVLEVLLEFHARAGGSAILLTATLPHRMKEALLSAYARGRHVEDGPAPGAEAFPLVTSWFAHDPTRLVEQAMATRDTVRRTVDVNYVSEQSQVVDAIESALAKGRCVCWIRNTVADALTAHALFAGRLPAADLTLFHARFALRDRLDTETTVLEHFGPLSTPEGRRGRLVIGTQVLEQSLDADWDVVITDLAPIDRLIQRAGRLLRHSRDANGARLADPAASDQRGRPCLWVYGPARTDTPPPGWFKSAFPKAANVYANHAQLWLTAQSIKSGSFSMPEDARQLIEGVFGTEVVVPDGLQASADRAEGKNMADASESQRNRLSFANGYGCTGVDWWGEAKAPSRLGEATMDVLLAKWQGDRLVPWVGHAKPNHAWAYSTVKIAERLIAETAVPEGAARQAELARVQATLPAKGKWSVLLMLDETPEGWLGKALDRRRSESEPGNQRLWKYDPITGLVLIGT